MADSVERVLAAAVEGQAQSLRFIQQQLSNLHNALAKANREIQAANKKDSKQSSSEVEVQYALALESVANCFSQSNFEAALDLEYKLARSEDSPNNLSPYGVVYIEPSRYNLVYSCVTAVAAAIAAGNCVILEMPRPLSKTSDLLTRTLSDALDRDTFTVVNKQIDFARLPKSCVRLHGSPNTDITSSESVLAVPTTRSIAIIDRYADMQQAASAVLRARFSFGGQSPIAPHLVLVNEFRVKEFCNAIAEKASKYFSVQLEANGGFDHSAAARARATWTSLHELDQAGAEIINSGSRGSVVRVNDRTSSILRKYISEPLLIIHTVTSLDDAIDFTNATSDDKPLAALHVFGSPEIGKYTSQFVHAHLSCVNNIPVELLVAPLTPTGFATQLTSPYRKEMFSMPKPQYIQFGEKSAKIAELIDNNDEREAAKLRKQAQMINTEVKQPAGHAIGYFEQGLLVGALTAVTSIVVGSVVLWKYGVPAMMRLRG